MAPDISIIMPAYNYAHFLPVAINSVLEQRTADFALELILIDDGSTDDTPAVAASFGEEIRYVRQVNQGPSAARNTGLASAQGEFILFLDADDFLAPGMLASQLSVLRAQPEADIAACLNLLARPHPQNGQLYAYDIWRLFKSNHAIHFCHFNILPIHACLVRKTLADKVGRFDVTLKACEDHDYWLRGIASGCKLAVNPEVLVVYRKHGSSSSDQAEKQWLHDALLHERVAKLLSERKDFLSERREDAYIAHAAGCIKTSFDLAPMRPDRAVDLLELFRQAVKNAAKARVLDNIYAPGSPQDTRGQEGTDVLHFYVNRIFLFFDLFQPLQTHILTDSYKVISKLYPEWELWPNNKIREMGDELTQRICVPQELRDVAGLLPKSVLMPYGAK